MTKQQFIDSTSHISDDTELMIWDGVVEDCVPLSDTSEQLMVRRSEESCYRDILMGLCISKKDYDYKPSYSAHAGHSSVNG